MKRLLLFVLVPLAILSLGASISPWGNTYETNLSDASPGSSLDDIINELRQSIRGRAETELCWGDQDSDGCGAADSGRAREGSARAFHVADCSAVTNLNAADDDGSATLGAGDDGRFCVDSDTGEEYYWTGSAWAPKKSVFSGAVVRTTLATATSDGTPAALTWDDELYDAGGWHDNAVNNSRLTVPAGLGTVYVRLTCNAIFDSDAGEGDRLLMIYKNGAFIEYGSERHWPGVNGAIVNVSSAVLTAVPTDYFECFAEQNSGGALNVNTGGGSGHAWFGLEVVR